MVLEVKTHMGLEFYSLSLNTLEELQVVSNIFIPHIESAYMLGGSALKQYL